MSVCMKLGILLTFIFLSLKLWMPTGEAFDPASFACVAGLFAFGLLLHRINRTGVRYVVSGLGAFSGAGSPGCGIKKKSQLSAYFSAKIFMHFSCIFKVEDVVCLLRQYI